MIEYDYAKDYIRARERYEDLTEQLKHARFDLLMAEDRLTEYLQDCGKEATAKYPDIGSISLRTPKLDYCTYDNVYEDEVFKFVEDMGEGPMIRRQIHPSAFSSFVRRMLKEGVPLPKIINFGVRPVLAWNKPYG